MATSYEDFYYGARSYALVRVHDVGLLSAEDPDVLAWANDNDRIILTHDGATIPHFAWQFMGIEHGMAGVFVLNDRMPVGAAIEEILLIDGCSEQSEWIGRVGFTAG